MEEWAGRAMGLNLRNSPEQVRRYLPLSVMWVANSKLKKVLDLLIQMTSSVEVTDEQMHMALQQLRSSIEVCGDAFERLQSNPAASPFTHDEGWTPWEMQIGDQTEALRERVTFERRGDPITLRAEIEARVREELRNEYEVRPLTLAARAELEKQLRGEIREEFEAKKQLQASVSGPQTSETLQEIEARLRSEIEIEVRREFLSQLTGEEEDVAGPAVQEQPGASEITLKPTRYPPMLLCLLKQRYQQLHLVVISVKKRMRSSVWRRKNICKPSVCMSLYWKIRQQTLNLYKVSVEQHIH